jgi:hypothetical protein
MYNEAVLFFIMEQTNEITNTLIQYANVFIPLVVSIITAVVAFIIYREKVNRLEEDMKELKQDMKSMNNDLIECKTKIEERTKSSPAVYAKSESPISLTDKGEDILKRSGADAFVLQNQQEFVDKVKKKNPQTAYDVQACAKEVIQLIVDEKRFNKFKDFVFKEGIDLDPIFLVMGIYLRDIALPLLGFKPEDIDKNDPNHNS